MFLERIKLLCKENGISQRKLEQELNLGNGATSKWVKSSPSIETLNRIAGYFNVSVDYLLGTEQTEKAPALTKRDERDIADFMEALEGGDTLMYYGEPLSEEAKESIKAAMRLGIGAAKLEAKRKFTPKKYRKE